MHVEEMPTLIVRLFNEVDICKGHLYETVLFQHQLVFLENFIFDRSILIHVKHCKDQTTCKNALMASIGNIIRRIRNVIGLPSAPNEVAAAHKQLLAVFLALVFSTANFSFNLLGCSPFVLAISSVQSLKM